MDEDDVQPDAAIAERRYDLIALGGTIASRAPDAESTSGVVPTLTAEHLGESLRASMGGGAGLTTVSFRQGASGDLTFDDIIELAELIHQTHDTGTSGVVVTQGTDTLAEVAFILSLLLDRRCRVVVTGAMRPASHPGADGPANLTASMRLLESDVFADARCLVVMNDRIFDPWLVYKGDASAVDSFRSRLGGAAGQFSEGEIHRTGRLWQPDPVHLPVGTPVPVVPIVPITFSGDQRAFEEALSPAHPCVVLDAFGGGHVPARFIPAIRDAVQRYPVVFASRCVEGVTLEHTYAFPGSEVDLRRAGAIPAGVLDTAKARILAALLIASGTSGDRFPRLFQSYATPSAPRE